MSSPVARGLIKRFARGAAESDNAYTPWYEELWNKGNEALVPQIAQGSAAVSRFLDPSSDEVDDPNAPLDLGLALRQGTREGFRNATTAGTYGLTKLLGKYVDPRFTDVSESLAGGTAGAIESTGKIASDMTSPVQLGLMALGLGGHRAAVGAAGAAREAALTARAVEAGAAPIAELGAAQRAVEAAKSAANSARAVEGAAGGGFAALGGKGGGESAGRLLAKSDQGQEFDPLDPEVANLAMNVGMLSGGTAGVGHAVQGPHPVAAPKLASSEIPIGPDRNVSLPPNMTEQIPTDPFERHGAQAGALRVGKESAAVQDPLGRVMKVMEADWKKGNQGSVWARYDKLMEAYPDRQKDFTDLMTKLKEGDKAVEAPPVAEVPEVAAPPVEAPAPVPSAPKPEPVTKEAAIAKLEQRVREAHSAKGPKAAQSMIDTVLKYQPELKGHFDQVMSELSAPPQDRAFNFETEIPRDQISENNRQLQLLAKNTEGARSSIGLKAALKQLEEARSKFVHPEDQRFLDQLEQDLHSREASEPELNADVPPEQFDVPIEDDPTVPETERQIANSHDADPINRTVDLPPRKLDRSPNDPFEMVFQKDMEDISQLQDQGRDAAAEVEILKKNYPDRLAEIDAVFGNSPEALLAREHRNIRVNDVTHGMDPETAAAVKAKLARADAHEAHVAELAEKVKTTPQRLVEHPERQTDNQPLRDAIDALREDQDNFVPGVDQRIEALKAQYPEFAEAIDGAMSHPVQGPVMPDRTVEPPESTAQKQARLGLDENDVPIEDGPKEKAFQARQAQRAADLGQTPAVAPTAKPKKGPKNKGRVDEIRARMFGGEETPAPVADPYYVIRSIDGLDRAYEHIMDIEDKGEAFAALKKFQEADVTSKWAKELKEIEYELSSKHSTGEPLGDVYDPHGDVEAPPPKPKSNLGGVEGPPVEGFSKGTVREAKASKVPKTPSQPTPKTAKPIEPSRTGELPKEVHEGPTQIGGDAENEPPDFYEPPDLPKMEERPTHGFRDWVNKRRSTPVKGEVIRKHFADLDDLGIQGLVDFQNNSEANPRFKEIRKYLDQRHKELRQAGVNLHYRQNYLPQMWEEAPQQVAQVSKALGLRPGFTQEAVFKNYAEGIEAGLTPKAKTLGEALGMYEQKVQKLLSDQKFFNFLKKNKVIKPEQTVPKDGTWEMMQNFPVTNYYDSNGNVVPTHYYAPANVAELINNYLKSPKGWGHKLARFNSILKNVEISSGIPGTGLNAHGASTLFRKTVSSGNPFKAATSGFADLLKPDRAAKRLQANLKSAGFAVDHGLMLSSEDHVVKGTSQSLGEMTKEAGWQDVKKSLRDAVKNPAKQMNEILSNPLKKLWSVSEDAVKAYKSLNAVHTKFFDEPLFQKVLPAWKLEHFNTLLEELKSRGVSEESAARQAAHTTNATFGGINIEELGRDQGLQNFLRSTLLAPDWFESNVRMLGADKLIHRKPLLQDAKGKVIFEHPANEASAQAGGILKAVRNPKSAQGIAYRNVIKNALYTYLGANILNYIATKNSTGQGKWMFENDSTHQFAVDTGRKDSKGKKVYVKYMGSGGDFVRLPAEALLDLTMHGNLQASNAILKNRLSPTLTAAGVLIMNSTWKGKPVFSQKVPLSDQLKTSGAAVSNLLLPQYGANAYDWAAGNIGPEEALSRTVEAPLTFSKGTRLVKRRKKHHSVSAR